MLVEIVDSSKFPLKLELEDMRDQGNVDGWSLYGVPCAMQNG